MQDVIGSLVPYAMTIALGPIPIIAIAIMLQTPTPAKSGMGFAVGWIVGMVVLTVGLIAISSSIPEGDAAHPNRWVGLVQLVLGIGLIFLSIKKVGSHFDSTEDKPLPGFLTSLKSTSPAKSLFVGFASASLNPKHVVLVIPVGTLIVQHGLSPMQHAVSIGVFVILASISVIGAAIGYLVSPDRVGRVVELGYGWMVRNMKIVSAAVLFLIGGNILGKGIDNFW